MATKSTSAMFRRSVYWAIAVVGTVVLISVFDASSRISTASQPESAETKIPASQAATATDALDTRRPQFKQAGVCARCHVISVLEWGISGHVAAETNCQSCHGPSRPHVANERNEIKPDRLPRGAQSIKRLCFECHEAGCPNTLKVDRCHECHHVHALLNPDKPPATKDDRLEELLARWDRFGRQLADGEQHVKRHDWKAAQAAFRAALELIPGNHPARTRLEMCNRRLNPGLPGFEIVGEQFDSKTGLPKRVRVAGSDIVMLLVPPGEFDMGSDELADSGPLHTVRVEAFYLGQFEVTQAEWAAVMGKNPSVHQGQDFADHRKMPVENVSWDDCQEFLRRLNAEVPGAGFRLPSEAEWEYVVRGFASDPSLSSKDPVSDSELSGRAWFRANSTRQPKPQGPFLQIEAYSPRPVGTRRASALGFHDLLGNVNEWCSSLFRPYLYDRTDGRESVSETGMRVVRGGGFADSAASLNPALRHAERPHRRLRWNGLRLARSVPASSQKESASKQQ